MTHKSQDSTKRLRIIFDGLALVDGHFSGIGQYTLGALRGIDKVLETHNNTRVYVMIPFDRRTLFNSFGFKHIRPILIPVPHKILIRLWRHRLLPPIDLFLGKAVYIFPNFVDMPLLHSPSVIVVYDLSYEKYRQFSDEANATWLSKYVKQSIARTNAVVAISEHAKQEITDFYKFDSANISVALPAADIDKFYKRSSKEIIKAKRKYGLPDRYILSLSNLEPRKNLETLVDAYAKLPKTLRDSVGLVLVGVSGWKTGRLFEKISKMTNEGYNIQRPNSYVSDDDKPAIISGAEVLAYPSYYEGFGMPPLEALACGTPVIVGNNSSLPEAVGNVGIFANIHDAADLAKVISDTLVNRSKISKKIEKQGPNHARTFSWVKSGEVFINLAVKLQEETVDER